MVLSIQLKSLFYEKFLHLFSKYNRIIIVNADNVGSDQLQKCRKALGKSSVLILGKNTIIRKVLKQHSKQNPSLKSLLPFVSGNIGFVFTEENPYIIKNILSSNRVPAPARVGQLAQSDVTIPSGPTNIDPSGTPFFQALNIPTKILKGHIEIQDEVKVITKGAIIQSSEAALLQKLNIVPFSYELQIIYIYDNEECYEPTVLEISSEQITENIKYKIKELRLVSKSIGYPIWGSVESSFKSLIANLLSMGMKIGYRDLRYSEKAEPLNNENKEKTPEKDQNTKPSESCEEISSDSGGFGLNLFD
mmetsp:Transcript_24072/g.48610  ORF Transcript_24072/g.48610 Transcript_24072/m.48610 type:complete len:305 (+) Transcript_24072:26-940(+)